jgi:hypothetical protein
MMMLGELIIDFYLDFKDCGLLNEDVSLKEKDGGTGREGPKHPEPSRRVTSNESLSAVRQSSSS